jgi:hypothetical protein
MVLVRDRSPEQREDAVAGILHVGIIVARGVDRYFQRRVDDRARLLRIQVLLELGRALDVGKECGDRLALTVRRGIRGFRAYMYRRARGYCWLLARILSALDGQAATAAFTLSSEAAAGSITNLRCSILKTSGSVFTQLPEWMQTLESQSICSAISPSSRMRSSFDFPQLSAS